MEKVEELKEFKEQIQNARNEKNQAVEEQQQAKIVFDASVEEVKQSKIAVSEADKDSGNKNALVNKFNAEKTAQEKQIQIAVDHETLKSENRTAMRKEEAKARSSVKKMEKDILH